VVASTVLFCTDGSTAASDALRAASQLLRPDLRPVLVTVVDVEDPSLVTGSGFAGGVMSEEELDAREQANMVEADAVLHQVSAEIGVSDADRQVLRGAAGFSICAYAAEVDAAAIAMGSRGRGGLKRAILGSVSDYVVRNAPCPVIVQPSH
jgi:nucleotide-binding universal stress UspA family protein